MPSHGQDIESFISSLPRKEMPDHTLYYQYQNFWYVKPILQGLIATQQQFRAQDSDIILATFPKCGTTWLKALVYTLVNRNLHPPVGNYQKHPLLTKNPHDLVPFLEFPRRVDNKVPDFSSSPHPRLLATHAPLKSLPESIQTSKSRIVYLCRNPKDTLISFWYFLSRTDKITLPLEEYFDRFCEGMIGYGPFWNHVLDYWKKSLESPEKVLFLTYEGLKDQPVAQLRRVADFLECPFSGDEESSGVAEAVLELCGFDNLSSLEVNRSGKISSGLNTNSYFRRGEVGDWKNHLTAEMEEQLDALTEQHFQEYGLKL